MPNKQLALCLLADGTASMGSALSAIKNSFVVIRATAILCKVKIYCAVYRDFDVHSGKGHEKGGVFISNELKNATEFDNFCNRFLSDPKGGASFEEAAVTAFNFLIHKLPVNCMILHFTDAICHRMKEMSAEATAERRFCKEVHKIKLESGEIIETTFEPDWEKIAEKIQSKFSMVTISDPSDCCDQSCIPSQFRTVPKKEMWPKFGKFLKLDNYSEEKITEAAALCFMSLIGNGKKSVQAKIPAIENVNIEKCIKDHAENSIETIFEALSILASPKGIPALITQDDFGKAWRIAISKKNREKFPEKVKNLLNSLSSAGNSLSKEMQEKLK